MKKLFLFLPIVLMVLQITAQNPKPPYPIIFVHGWAGSDGAWTSKEGDWKTFFESFNWKFGGYLDVCVENSSEQLNEHYSVDVMMKNIWNREIKPNSDFYLLNFNVNRVNQLYPEYVFNFKNRINYKISPDTEWLYLDDGDDGDIKFLNIGDILQLHQKLYTSKAEYVKVITIDEYNNRVRVERGVLGSEAEDWWNWSQILGIFTGGYTPAKNLSNLSNQGSIVKSAKGLKLAIDAVLNNHQADKVILIAHSMGGLVCREYIQSDDFNSDVAKLFTISSPHQGSNTSNLDNLPGNIENLLKFDLQSDAVRDLRFSTRAESGKSPSENDNAPYLFGDDTPENSVSWSYLEGLPFYRDDINCDGKFNDTPIKGLNHKPWPSVVPMHCAVAYTDMYLPIQYPPYLVNIKYNTDQIVMTERQVPPNNIFDTESYFVTHSLSLSTLEANVLFDEKVVHNASRKVINECMHGLDEPNSSEHAFELRLNSEMTFYNGFITTSDQSFVSTDIDWFKFTPETRGELELFFKINSNKWLFEIIGPNQEKWTIKPSTLNKLIICVEKDQTYFIKVSADSWNESWQEPYLIGLKLHSSPIVDSYVNPIMGTTYDDLIFSVIFKDESGLSPQIIKLIVNGEFVNELNYKSDNIQSGALFESNAIRFFNPGIYQYHFEVITASGVEWRYPLENELDLRIYDCPGVEINHVSVLSSLNKIDWNSVYGNISGGYELLNFDVTKTYYFDVNTITFSEPGKLLMENYFNPFYLDGSSDPLFYLLYSSGEYSLIDGAEYEIGNPDEIFSLPGNTPMGKYKLNGIVVFDDGCEYPLRTSFSIGDYTPPILSCSNNITVYADPYVCGAVVYFDHPGVEDQSETVLRQVSGPESGDLFPIGKTTIIFEAVDKFGNSSSCSFTVTVKERPTYLVYNGDLEGQYSDPVILSATLIDRVSRLGVRGKTIHFTIGEQKTSAVTDYNGYAETTLILDQDPCKDFTVRSVFEHDCPYLPSSDNDPFDILPEDVEVEYVGVLLQATPSLTSTTATVKLMATIREVDDGYPGDISKALVSFIDRASSSIADCIPVGYFVDPSDPTTGVVTFDWTVTIPKNTNAVVTELGILAGAENCESCYYRHNDTEDDAIVVVYIPEGDFITGGGYIKPEYSAGPFASSAGTKANFGFNVKYTKRGNKLQGMLTMIIRSGENVYQIKSNALTSLGTNIKDKNAKIGVFSAKANLKDVTDELNPFDLHGNLILKVTMTDRGEPGSYDGIGVTLWSAVKAGESWVADELLYSSNWTGMNTVEDILSGGNLVVHSGANINVDAEEGEPVVQPGGKKKSASIDMADLNLQVYPNPFNDKLYFEFEWNQSTSARIDLYDAIGRKIETIFDQQIEENQHYRIEYQPGNLATNMLYYRMIFGKEVVTGKVIYKK